MSAPAVSLSNRDLPRPSPEEILRQLGTLLASRPLRESHQLKCFLEFVVRETLAGRQDGLKEYLVGCQVFGRKPDYEPRHDGIVRVQATTLRKRLEKFYAEDGATHRVLIELPRGGYVPTFRYRPPALNQELEQAVAPAPITLPLAPSLEARPKRSSAVKPFVLSL